MYTKNFTYRCIVDIGDHVSLQAQSSYIREMFSSSIREIVINQLSFLGDKEMYSSSIRETVINLFRCMNQLIDFYLLKFLAFGVYAISYTRTIGHYTFLVYTRTAFISISRIYEDCACKLIWDIGCYEAGLTQLTFEIISVQSKWSFHNQQPAQAH